MVMGVLGFVVIFTVVVLLGSVLKLVLFSVFSFFDDNVHCLFAQIKMVVVLRLLQRIPYALRQMAKLRAG